MQAWWSSFFAVLSSGLNQRASILVGSSLVFGIVINSIVLPHVSFFSVSARRITSFPANFPSVLLESTLRFFDIRAIPMLPIITSPLLLLCVKLLS